jgi:hypothetical protein
MDEPKFKKDIAVICNYLHEEKKHYEESGKPGDHIWCYVRRMQRWLKTA